jgi:hypothetical protein
MFELGFFMKDVKKGLYFDGHEREDVVEYRKKFLERLQNLCNLMSVFEGEDMIEIEPVLTPGQKKIIMINHDESTFAANDGKKTLYLEESETVLRKKGAGACLMVSGFLCPCHDQLYYIDDAGQKVYARAVIAPGAGKDGWWTNEDLIKQLKEKA